MTEGEPFIRWDWIADHLGLIWGYLVDHVVLTLIAITVGFAISFALSLAIYRWRRLYPPIVAVTGIIFTIPSLALFMVFIPITGIANILTGEIPLIGYTLLIFIRNIIAGLDGVPADIKEAAEAMGYTASQRLWRIELPLALPVIVAGIRIATVTTIGLVTVTAFIGLGNLGQLIYEGLFRFFTTPLYVGAILSVVLAFLADALLVHAQRAITPWSRARGA